MKIKYILEIITSKGDMYGNRYCAFVFTSTETGKFVKGRMGYGNGENARSGVFRLNGVQHVQNFATYYTEMKIRDFNRHTKTWMYADNVDVIAKLMATVNDA